MQTPETRAAYIVAMAACANASVAAMQAENDAAKSAGRPQVYNYHDFEGVPNAYGIHHNAVVSFLNG